MEILQVYASKNFRRGSVFVIKDNIPCSVMIWEAIKKCLQDKLPDLFVRILPGPHEDTDNDCIEVDLSLFQVANPEVHNIIEDITFDRIGGCRALYKGQVITP